MYYTVYMDATTTKGHTMNTGTCSRCEETTTTEDLQLHSGWCGSCYASKTDGCDCETCTEWNRTDDEAVERDEW